MVVFRSCSNHQFILLGKRLYLYVVESKPLFSAQQFCLMRYSSSSVTVNCIRQEQNTEKDVMIKIHRFRGTGTLQKYKNLSYIQRQFLHFVKVHKGICLVLSTLPISRYTKFFFLILYSKPIFSRSWTIACFPGSQHWNSTNFHSCKLEKKVKLDFELSHMTGKVMKVKGIYKLLR